MKLIRDIPDIYCAVIEEGLHKPTNDRLTVTELVNPPLIKYLKIKHWDDIEVKASDFLWMILGKAVHGVFEKSGITRDLRKLIERCEDFQQAAPIKSLTQLLESHSAEKPIEITVKDTKIRGRIDIRESGIIRDLKITSVWAFIYGVKPEWKKQLNIYAFMSKKLGVPVNKLFVEAILRDWKKVETYRNKDYPKMPFVTMPVKLWTEKEQYNYILKRITAYNVESAECSSEEKWEKPTTYAVKKPKRKRATRVFDTDGEALKYINEHKDKKYEMEVRKGKCTRCEDYCDVNEFCPFFKNKGK